MKQPLILTAAERTACANALAVRERGYYALAFKDNITWSHGLVRRAETYLAFVHFRAVCAGSVALLLAVQGHALLLDFIKAAGWSRTAAQILADVAFGPDLNPEPAPASE